MSKKLTQEEAIFKIKESWGEEYDLSQVVYEKATTPLILTCKLHGEFTKNLNKLTSGKKEGCPKCGLLRRANSKRVEQDDIINRIKKIHGEDTYDFSRFEYRSMKERVTLGCKTHGWFEILPNTLIFGKSGCAKCGRERSEEAKYRTLESVLTQAKDAHNNKYDYSNITEDTYKGTTHKYVFNCPTHGEFKQTMEDHMVGKGCQKCGHIEKGLKKRLPKEEVFKRCNDTHNNTYDYSETVYITDKTPFDVKCKKHGVFSVLPINHMRGSACPRCAKKHSKAEIELRDFLSQYIDLEHSNRKLLGDSSEVDIFIRSKKLAIEYNGLYFHSDKFQDEKYHLDKTEKAQKLGLSLIHIFEDEWKEKRSIVESRLLNLIGLSKNKIYARQTEVRELDSKTTNSFLELNHIQGKSGAKIRLGLYHKEELVSVMTFGDFRKALGAIKSEDKYEMIRFCNKLNTNVVGGASKILKYFVKHYSPKEIISYADRRWSEGKLYETLGFSLDSITPPNYHYTKGDKRENRFTYRKDRLVDQGFDKSKTEKQIMEERGFKRIYDCGSLKYKLIINQKIK